MNAAALMTAKFGAGADGTSIYHPLICHMIDVAVVAETLWEEYLAKRVRGHLADSLQLDQGSVNGWVSFLAAVHDLGKATPVFQAKGSQDRHSTPLWLVDSSLEFPRLRVADPGHGTVTAAHLPGILTKQFNIPPETATRLAVVTGGHHGIFPTAKSRSEARGIRLGEPRQGEHNPWADVRDELGETLAHLLGLAGAPGLPSNAASMLLAGFISIVDWIGSIDDPRFFPYAPDGHRDLPAYIEARRRRAPKALALLHWDAWPQQDGPLPFRKLFTFAPRHLQGSTEQIAPDIGAPGLAILEAPMGEGKTEAAFYLADFWNALGFRGSYIAMPTQATSNQLYGRFKEFLEGRYGSGDIINLQLLHGHASLDAEIKLLQMDGTIFGPSAIDQDGDDRDATVGAAEWFTHRKRGLLAPFGVGTVDQALLSVLQVKHGSVRLFGLAGKTVIIDEVHAYDTYMTTLLERLLEWLAALGSPVVLLSATLPSARRKALADAYIRGLGCTPAPELTKEAYPRITWTTQSGELRACTVKTSLENQRHLVVRWLLLDSDGLPVHLLVQLRDGGCAVVICNTVNRAQELYVALRDAYASLPENERPGLDLFHARFLFKDRSEREERCLRLFGKPNREGGTTADRPLRSILVATQVIEQSLDLDFDIMISEIAPLDLLLQRSGRLQRHKRADRRGADGPVLQVLSPDLGGDGLPAFERASTYVYDEHILLRTWHALRDREAIAIPGDIEGLIDEVYKDSGEPPAGSADALATRWRKTFATMEKKRWGQEAIANQPLIPSPIPTADFPEEEFFEVANAQLLEDRPDAARSRQARTRYEELPTVRVVWLRQEEAGRAEVRAGDRDGVRDLLLRSVSLQGHWVAVLYTGEFLPPSWQSNSILRHYRLMTVPEGRFQVPEGPELSLDDDLGIVVRFNTQLTANTEPGAEEVQHD